MDPITSKIENNILQIYEGDILIDTIGKYQLQNFKFSTDKKNKLPSIYHIIKEQSHNKRASSGIDGLSGQIKDYFYYPCVIAYAKTTLGSVIIIRTINNVYKGILYVRMPYGDKIMFLNLDKAMTQIKDFKFIKTQIVEMPEEDLKKIFAKRI